MGLELIVKVGSCSESGSDYWVVEPGFVQNGISSCEILEAVSSGYTESNSSESL